MKSELPQIHESKLLADKVEGFLVKVRDKLSLILVAFVLCVLGLFGWGIYKSVQNTQFAAGWNALYFTDTDTEDLNSIAQDFANSPAARWSNLAAGDAHLAKGSETVYTNRDIADQHFQKAVTSYESVTSQDVGAFVDGLLFSRAYYGLGQAYEGLGKREEAAAAYRKISEQIDQDLSFLSVAMQRASWLESKDGEQFFVWYNANRQAAPTIAPAGDRPQLPDAPTFNFSTDPNPSTESNASEEASVDNATESSEAPKSEEPANNESADQSSAETK